ncbi:MAG: ParA family protein [Bacilli bacterium]|jgi:chromosome partitioning protein|nr:ParA family protein [Bacilli bacterium]
MGKIIAVANQKGGVGKTTTAINLASALAHYQKNVLLVDMDPQGNCSRGIGVDPSLLKLTIVNLLLGETNFDKIVRKTSADCVVLLPANLSLAAFESEAAARGIKIDLYSLKKCLDPLSASYDYIIIDCPPSLGYLSLSSLTAADEVLIPVQCEYFAMEAVAQILSAINNIRMSANPNLSILGFLLTMYDNRNKLSTEVSSEVISTFKEKTFATRIPRNITLAEAVALGKPAELYKPSAAGSLAYQSLAREIMAHE